MRMQNDDTSKHRLPIPLAGTRLPPPTDLRTVWASVHTERVLLRCLRAEDGPAMFTSHGDPATNQYNPTRPDPAVATSEETLRRWRHHSDLSGFGYWAAI